MKADLSQRPRWQRGARVRVHEQGLREWEGTVTTVKPSRVSGWWMDVRRDDGDTYALCLATAGMTIEEVQ